MTAPEDPPLAWSIGAFFGHIVDAIVSDPNARTERVECGGVKTQGLQ